MVPPLDELCKAHEEEVDEEEEEEDEDGSYHVHLESLVQNLLKEAKDKSKGWVSRSTTDHTELAFKKVCGCWISGISLDRGDEKRETDTLLVSLILCTKWTFSTQLSTSCEPKEMNQRKILFLYTLKLYMKR